MSQLLNVPWSRFRQQMPITRRWIYLDHSAVAPLPQPAADAIQAWSQQATTAGDTVWPEWYSRLADIRRRAAKMLNASPDEIALMPSTTAGIGVVAEGYPWSVGDNVVTLANEFPSNLYPWLNLAGRGVETRRVEVFEGRVDPQRVAEACDQRTRIVAVSWVGYVSGYRIDVGELARIAHDQGALLLLDAIQGLGVFPLNVSQTGVDFLAADGHKWLLGPEGAGLFFLRREHLDRLRPVGVGWHSARNPFGFRHEDFQLRDDAARYEGGSQNMVGMVGLLASLELLGEYRLGGGSLARGRSSAAVDRIRDLTVAIRGC